MKAKNFILLTMGEQRPSEAPHPNFLYIEDKNDNR
jgi:hypothetical protein